MMYVFGFVKTSANLLWYVFWNFMDVKFKCKSFRKFQISPGFRFMFWFNWLAFGLVFEHVEPSRLRGSGDPTESDYEDFNLSVRLNKI